MTQIQGIIFDLGQTLLQFTGDWSTVVRHGAEAMASWYLQKKRLKLDQARLVEAFISERKAGLVLAMQTHREVTAESALKEALLKIEAPARALTMLDEAVKVYFELEESQWQLYPDTLETLKMLKKQGYFLGLYSNATDDFLIQRLVNQHKLRPLLSPTFSSAAWGWRKPKPDLFKVIAQRWGLDPAAVVVVGDTLNADILGAQNAGMASVLVTMSEPPSNEDNRHIKPNVAIPSLATLPGVLAKLSVSNR